MLRKNNNFVVDAGRHLSPKKKRKSAPSQEALGLPQRKDEEESYLESKVFGGENLLLDTLLEKRLTSQHTEVYSLLHSSFGIFPPSLEFLG